MCYNQIFICSLIVGFGWGSCYCYKLFRLPPTGSKASHFFLILHQSMYQQQSKSSTSVHIQYMIFIAQMCSFYNNSSFFTFPRESKHPSNRNSADPYISKKICLETHKLFLCQTYLITPLCIQHFSHDAYFLL